MTTAVADVFDESGFVMLAETGPVIFVHL